LARWGIDIMSMEKTAATMAEMSMDLSMKLQFDRVQESGEDLVPVEGPGFVGLYNFGNNCYINSLLQVLFSLPEFSRRYLVATDVLANRAPADPAQDFNTQMSKLATAMLTERYAALTDEEEGLMNIAPKMLKNVVASTNAEFNNTQQQDVFQYYQHFMETIQRAERRGGGGQEDLSTLFTFALEERLECKQSGQVAYKRQEGHNALLLPVPFQQFAATLSPEGVAGAEGSEPESKKAKTAPDATADVQVPFEACMEAYAAAQALEGYLSPVTSTRGEAAKTVRFASFPKYLAVQMQRFVLGPDWRATKINASVHMPNTLDLSSLKATGLQADEVAMASSSASQPAATLPDADIVASLTAMGFSENGCKRACVATENANTEAAMEWVLAHMGDADFDTPLPASAAPVPAGGAAVSYAPEAVGMLCSMGFTEKQVIKAMGECNGDADRAAEWLFSRMGTAELDDAPSAPQGESAPVAEAGSSKYELVGFITHMGPNTNCGHYVCHILKDGKWIIFNDQKVALSKSPPLDLGYVYFYRQVS
jgi:ubiquitin carboxyl-terminal hydrolase 5/13